MRDLRVALSTHSQRLPLRFLTSTRTGEIRSRRSNNIGGVQPVVTYTATSVMSNVAITQSTIFAIWLIDWRLALVPLGLWPVFMGLTYQVGNVRREIAGTTQRSPI